MPCRGAAVPGGGAYVFRVEIYQECPSTTSKNSILPVPPSGNIGVIGRFMCQSLESKVVSRGPRAAGAEGSRSCTMQFQRI